MRFDPTAESISEYLQRYLATHQRCRVKGVKLKLELEELAETLPEIVHTKAGGHSKGTFSLRGTIRKFIQDHPGADAHDLGDEIRRSVRYFNLDLAMDEGEELPTKQNVRQFTPRTTYRSERSKDSKKSDEEKKTRKKWPKRVKPTDDQVQEILAELDIGKESEKPCAICAKYNDHLKDWHSTDQCWNHPDVEKPEWMGNTKRKRVNRLFVRAVDGKVASDAELRVRIAEDFFALVDTGATVSTLHPRTESKLQVVQKLDARTSLYMADGKTTASKHEAKNGGQGSGEY